MQVLQRRILIGLVLAVVSAVVLSAQKENPLAGTWQQNVAKSKYSPADLAVKSGTTNIEVTQNGVKLVNDGVDGQGRPTHTEYTASFDGKDYPVKATVGGKPSPNQDAVTWKKIDDYTYENVAKLKGQTLTTTRVVVSKDGKTRTNTVTGKNAQGQTVSNVVVFEKK
jgi:hypothetical protein